MFTLLAEHRTTLNQLAGLIQAEQTCSEEIYSEAIDMATTLKRALQMTDDKFHVLIIGAFSCGKTSMINALIGEDLLHTSFLPEESVLVELHYGKQKRVILYPKGVDEPFDLREVTKDEIRKYVSLCTEDAINAIEQNGDDVRITAKFEKMIIYWPLDTLKDGVVLVDSPGINDPYSNDYIVNDYLPKADAIVYVMNSTMAYTSRDKVALETLNTLGHKEIFFAYTFYDIVEKELRRKPERLRTLRKTLINHMMKHTDLGEVSIHFLDSIGGLDAKLDNDREALRRSGFEDFEDYLDQYLVESRGTAQVKEIISVIVNQADKMIRDAQFVINCRKDLEDCLSEVEQMVRTFLTKELPERIDLYDFQPESLPYPRPGCLYKFIDPNKKRMALKAIKDECEEELLRRINFEYNEWASNTLSDYLKKVAQKSEVVKNFPGESFVAGELLSTFPRYVFALNNLDTFQIKIRVAEYAKDFFHAAGPQKKVDNMVSDIMSDVKSYVEKTCAGAEKILRDEMENTERIVRRMVEDGKATLEEKTAQINQRTAAVDKLNNIKEKALQIGRDHGIRF